MVHKLRLVHFFVFPLLPFGSDKSQEFSCNSML